jgi:isoleucyl-tRNA synthetase
MEHTAKSLDAERRYAEELRELLNVSQLSFVSQASEGAAWTATVKKADGQKCERCWHWETDVGADSEHPGLCGRCSKAVREATA